MMVASGMEKGFGSFWFGFALVLKINACLDLVLEELPSGNVSPL